MKIGFFTVGLDTPAARYRVRQFVPHFERHGIRCEHHYAYGEAYNRLLGTPWATPYKLATRVRRAVTTLYARPYDLIFLQRTALPGTAWPERIAAAQGRPLIFDFDDAIYLDERGAESVYRRKAFQDAIDCSALAIAGTEYLRAQGRRPEKTTVIPTVIDTEAYQPKTGAEKNDAVVIGWMGTASNFPSLRTVWPAVRRVLERRPKSVFRIVSNGRLPELERQPQVQMVQWTAARELADLQGFDLGVMPLEDNEITRGKCGFKLILYMAVGIPVLASPVGANIEIVSPEVGVVPSTDEQWSKELERLVDDAALRRRLGEAARARAVAKYSVQSVLPLYLSQFSRLAGA